MYSYIYTVSCVPAVSVVSVELQISFIFLEADLMYCKLSPRCIRYPRFT